MDNLYLSCMVVEIAPVILHRQISRASLNNHDLVLGFEGVAGQRLVVVLDPSSPGLYLAKRWPAKSRQSGSILMKLDQLDGLTITEISKHPNDRVVWMKLRSPIDGSETRLVFSLTGRAANVFLFDSQGLLTGKLLNRKGPAPDWQPDFDRQDWTGNTADYAQTRLGSQLDREVSFRSEQPENSGKDSAEIVGELLNEPAQALVYSSRPLEEIGTVLSDPVKALALSSVELTHLRGYHRHRFDTFSEAAERYYAARSAAASLFEDVAAAKRDLTAAVRKKSSQLASVESDLEKYSEPERFKRFGDLILANLNSARVTGESIRLTDYFDPEQNEIEIPLPPNKDLKQTATHYYQLNAKAKRAREDLIPRAKRLRAQLDRLNELLKEITDDPSGPASTRVRAYLGKFPGRQAPQTREATEKRKKKDEPRPQGRRFESSDGFEIIVGRNDTENDSITFRIAGSQDIWLHAADYPGSHVVIRNPRRQNVPYRTIVEAAQVAAFYSAAKNQKKAAVHYTQKKFVSKPPRAKPGLVRLSSFKTVMVEPNRRVGEGEGKGDLD